MRVCHVAHALRRGGAERVLLELAEVAPDVGMEMQVLCLMPFDEGMPYAGMLSGKGVEVRSLGLRSCWDPMGLLSITPAIADLAPDVIHAHMRHADLLAAVASRQLEIPMVSTLHVIEQPEHRLEMVKGWLAGRARRAVARRTIAVSDAQRRWYLARSRANPAEVSTIYNGVADPPRLKLSERRRVRRDLGVGDETVLVAMVSLMRPGKGHVELLAAADRFAGRGDVAFLIVGDGPLRSQVERAAEAVDARVILVGFRDDVGQLFAASDLAVHPSLADALPTAAIQALAAGLPVVASDVGGVPEVVTNDVGVLVPPGDIGALAAALDDLVGDPNRRATLGAAARARFLATFEVNVWARQLARLYEEVRTATPTPVGAVTGRAMAP